MIRISVDNQPVFGPVIAYLGEFSIGSVGQFAQGLAANCLPIKLRPEQCFDGNQLKNCGIISLQTFFTNQSFHLPSLNPIELLQKLSAGHPISTFVQSAFGSFGVTGELGNRLLMDLADQEQVRDLGDRSLFAGSLFSGSLDSFFDPSIRFRTIDTTILAPENRSTKEIRLARVQGFMELPVQPSPYRLHKSQRQDPQVLDSKGSLFRKIGQFISSALSRLLRGFSYSHHSST